ncbi:hypothetical protein [Microbacterium sp. 10M-3C3]|jgi:hypothetical protein|uniref:hypothetical protein n=1 Tax=Microbacterium sp. 10M-3C3 TaxID=2483401 RepID=UPI000F62FB8D|nr:hypothetical protein [Microbacterium sp. 10M-3C3]
MSYTGGGLSSPNKHYVLTELDGDPDDIESAGNSYKTIGEQLEWTATELDKLSSEERYTAKGLDAIRESAGELAGELHKVAKRYSGTGPVLVTYSAALRTARSQTVDPLVSKIQQAHQAHQQAQEKLDDAHDKADDLDHTMPWEDDPTDAQKAAAASAVSDAETAEGTAASALDDLWVSFESGYGAWESAYDDAVSGVEHALDASGINDSWWEDLLDGIATVATILGTILVIAALAITGPIAAVLLAVAAALSAIALIAHLTMMACGSKRVSMTDILFDAIGVVPFLGAFGKGLRAGQGFAGAFRGALGMGGATRATITAGRNAVASDIRSIAGAGGRYGGRAAREARAPGIADDFLNSVTSNWGRSTWNALRYGGTRLDGQAATLAERMASAWPGGRIGPASRNWLGDLANPGPLLQGTNVWNAGYGVYQSAQGLGVPLPDMPDFVPNPFR